MKEVETKGDPYVSPENPADSGETTNPRNFYEKNPIASMAGQLADSIDRTPVPKLFMVLLMILYGVISFSKGASGVSKADLSHLLFFAVRAIGLIFALYISALIYRWIKTLTVESFSIFLKNSLTIALLLVVLVALLVGLWVNYETLITLFNFIDTTT